MLKIGSLFSHFCADITTNFMRLDVRTLGKWFLIIADHLVFGPTSKRISNFFVSILNSMKDGLRRWIYDGYFIPEETKLRFLYGPILVPFCLFLSFSDYNLINTNWKSVDGVLGIWTLGCRIVGTDETTELWQPPHLIEKF